MIKQKYRSFLIGALWGGESKEHFDETMAELRRLAETAGVEVADVFSQQLSKPNSATFIGKGKLKEISSKAKSQNVDTLIFNNNLSPSQARNISDQSRCNVVDRTELILDIFAGHAKTKQARLQVELAQLEYAYTKLKRLWKHLSRIEGGIGFRGPGETQIEIDRREIRRRIKILKEKLKEIDQTAQTKRKQRSSITSIALVGYTNAGKSTLFNKLTRENLFTADQLFATLDATTRSMLLPDGSNLVITDTIGFIRDLPPKLISSFHSTLTEVIEAELLLHVVDVSHPNVRDLMQSVHNVLRDLGVDNKNILVVFNKADLISGNHFKFVLKSLTTQYPDSVLISARTGEGLSDLISKLEKYIKTFREIRDINVPISLTNLIEFIRLQGDVLKEEICEEKNELKMKVNISRNLLPGIKKQISNQKMLDYIES